MTLLLIILDLGLMAVSAWFAFESHREHEPRAPYFGLAGLGAGVVLLPFIFWAPLRPVAWVFFGILIVFGLILLIPGRPDARKPKGSAGWIQGEVARVDERDIVFARNRSLRPGSPEYQAYYAMRPEYEEGDRRRREMGGPLGRPGRIDQGYRPNVSMILASFGLPGMLGPHVDAEPRPDAPPEELSPEKATMIVKSFARHLGADQVGVARVDPRWVYSHRGEIHYQNWDEDWGREITSDLPFAVVVATRMDPTNVGAGPHTPCAVESSANYALGAYITSILAQWFSLMGYRGAAEHNRRYNTLVVPLAVDAGLGELGRQGYLIAPRHGARVRLFACLTDMPLVPDEPVSLGVDEFCQRCKKCAICCPSRSIPREEKTVHNGVLRWKLNAETCFDYWGKVGTDCSICMGVCPFSRPDSGLHNVVRWLVARSPAARLIFPHLDNLIYGRKWRPRPVPEWVAYPQGIAAKPEKEEY